MLNRKGATWINRCVLIGQLVTCPFTIQNFNGGSSMIRILVQGDSMEQIAAQLAELNEKFGLTRVTAIIPGADAIKAPAADAPSAEAPAKRGRPAKAVTELKAEAPAVAQAPAPATATAPAPDMEAQIRAGMTKLAAMREGEKDQSAGVKRCMDLLSSVVGPACKAIKQIPADKQAAVLAALQAAEQPAAADAAAGMFD